jgi:glyoxylase-like metal-dependent hydrolase (beta-lactamase superfamily II)
MQIHQNLRNAGIDPGQVTKVLMSHLHKDHAGGITERSEALADCAEGNRGEARNEASTKVVGEARETSEARTKVAGEALAPQHLSFPNATYYVQKRELEYAFEKGPTSYRPEELECLRTSSQVVLLDGDGVLDGYIRYTITGAHCPWHQVFWIVDGGETVFFGGDVAPQLQQMKSRFVAKYDYDGKKAMELRQQWWEQGRTEGWTFLFYHDVKTPTWPDSH